MWKEKESRRCNTVCVCFPALHRHADSDSVMKEHNHKDEVMKIMEEAPSARKALLENYDNLLSVADYCYNNYVQVGATAAVPS